MLVKWMDWLDGRGALGQGALPDVKRTTGGGYRQSQPLTRGNVEAVLAWAGLCVRFDMMRQALRYVWTVEGVTFSDDDEPGVYQRIVDALLMLDIAVSRSVLDEVLLAVGRADRFHPMADWLDGLAWDGRDYIGELAGSVVTDCELWPTYLENWLVQVVDGVCGWRAGGVRQGLPYVLVLVGPQGIGKTHWFRQLGAGWLKTDVELQLGTVAGRDHQLQALRWPMCELGELDGIFRKADVAHLKSFLSRPCDEIRAPYARRAVETPRMTTFCGSVNVGEFLVDDTGSRRFWPVAVDRISWPDGLDVAGVWAQAVAWWRENADFTLSAAEEALRDAAARATHTSRSAVQEMIQDYWTAHKNCPDMFRAMNRTEILEMLGFRHLSPKHISEASQLLADISGKMRTIDGKQRAYMFPYSEFAHDSRTWKTGGHLHLIS